ncbi:hypothetical protein NOR_00619 [Metarhizium rileyi]|uniref:DUF6598 domain-containing protein n=1 Tax=Metarhizium rileyi (strain RCEF 4871) TaxID=1649241 RepID=A0A167KQ17_METRR|nr:hypothetical protein NOR_00619 [Metarhizium rileyi RCEF 4871]
MLQPTGSILNDGEANSDSVSLYSRGQKKKRRIYLAIYHRFDLSTGKERMRLGHSAFHWAILISPKEQGGKDTDAFDVTDSVTVDQATGELVNLERLFRLQVKKGVDPSRAKSLLGRIQIGTLDNDLTIENIEALFSRVPIPSKFASPPESCVNWALCAIMHLQIFGEVASFDRRLFSDWVLDYADRQLLVYPGEAMLDVVTYGVEQENEQRERDGIQRQLQAIDWASVEIPDEARPDVAMGMLTPEECSKALVALVALWASKRQAGKRMVNISARDGATADSCRDLAKEVSKPGVCFSKPTARPLAEILWVMIDDIDGENPGDLFGTITVADNLGSQSMFSVDKSDAVSTAPRTQLVLNRARPIAADGDFTVYLDLWDYDADASPHDQISRGIVTWKASDANRRYDEAIQTEIYGVNGKATVDYVVMRNPTKARIQVVLVNGDGERPADIYGQISISSRFVQRDIFQRDSGDNVKLNPWSRLAETTVAVPLDDTLTIHANVWDHDADWSPDDQVAYGSATFTPKTSGKENRSLSGEYGSIIVSVTWEAEEYRGC